MKNVYSVKYSSYRSDDRECLPVGSQLSICHVCELLNPYAVAILLCDNGGAFLFIVCNPFGNSVDCLLYILSSGVELRLYGIKTLVKMRGELAKKFGKVLFQQLIQLVTLHGGAIMSTGATKFKYFNHNAQTATSYPRPTV